MRPEKKDNLVSCPICDRLDNVALVSENIAVMWCCCGAIIKFDIEDGTVVDKFSFIYKL